MGRKSANRGDKRDQRKPTCFYCLRTFDNEDTLFEHQKLIHFRCEQCGKKFGNAPALGVHMKTMHEIELKNVPKADFGRDNPLLHIVGTDGIPPHIDLHEAIQHQKRQKLDGAASPAASVAAPQVQAEIGGLVYADEYVSPEEKRAMLPKYRFDERTLTAKLSQKNASIEDRLRKALARRGQ